MTPDELWEDLLDRGIATEEEMKLVTCINGFTVQTLNDILYARTGYEDIEQLDEEE